jgi:hypothetical protein
MHLMPTSPGAAALGLPTAAEWRQAEQEIAILRGLLRMDVELAAGRLDVDPAAPCAVLQGLDCNVDYRGRLSLCCHLAGFSGGIADDDVVADLHSESFAAAYPRLRALAAMQVARRAAVLAEPGASDDLERASPCRVCLRSFGKVPWTRASFPVRPTPAATA